MRFYDHKKCFALIKLLHCSKSGTLPSKKEHNLICYVLSFNTYLLRWKLFPKNWHMSTKQLFNMKMHSIWIYHIKSQIKRLYVIHDQWICCHGKYAASGERRGTWRSKKLSSVYSWLRYSNVQESAGNRLFKHFW